MPYFELLKLVHVSTAIVTIFGFVLRGIWMLRSSPLLQHRLAKVLPHIVDTLFLLSGVGLVLALHLPVLRTPWLIAKLMALLVYIMLGTVALKRGTTIRIRSIAFAGAVTTFAYIAGVAVSKSTLSWLALV